MAFPSLCEEAVRPARSHTHHHPKGETSSTAAAYSSLRTSAEQCARTRKVLELTWLALEYHPSLCKAAHSPCYTCGARSHTHHHPKGETSSTAAAYSTGTQGAGAVLVGPRVSSLDTSFVVQSSTFALLYLWCQIPHTPPPQRRDLKHSSRLQFPAHKRKAMCSGTQGAGAGPVGPRVPSLGTSFVLRISAFALLYVLVVTGAGAPNTYRRSSSFVGQQVRGIRFSQCPPCMTVFSRCWPGLPSSGLTRHCPYFLTCAKQRIRPAVSMMFLAGCDLKENARERIHIAGIEPWSFG